MSINFCLIFQNKHLFTGTGAQRLIGLREDVQEFKVADLSETHWTHVFVESRGKNRKLMPGSSFLFCEYTLNTPFYLT